MLNRRSIHVAASITLLAVVAPAQAWTWGFNEQVKGSGEVVSETRDLGGFDAISLSGSYKVLVRQGPAVKLEVKADTNLLPLIETRVVEGSKGRTLEIGTKKGFSFSSKTEPQIILVMPQLRSLAIAGSGDVRVEAMKTPELHASVSGSGDIDLVDFSSESLSVQVSGSGDIKASGRTGSFSLSVAGSGDVDARGLQADAVKASIAGSGNASVHAVNSLKISIAGSGDIGYLGSPKVSSSVAGHGVITKLN
ncbi:head GIN domain-containing protein [Roseateles sp.]|uniref:head GIN domain-containing protein n=1 Tax=Roseateles sp. TaxID=1971397 RepID=UPI00286D3252|nr:head GIN domain-containing protein [Roseateles sp.]